MREQQTDIWSTNAQAICVTTNGYVTASGRGVMGRGVALQAKARFAGIERVLGAHLKTNGNPVGKLIWGGRDGQTIVAFPVKHTWEKPADPILIHRSALELVMLADAEKWERVVLPRPGCGNGRLKWEVVKPLIEPFLDDRFLVVHQ